MIKPESLSFPPLHCSLDRELGDYYQDFGPAVQLVESGYHGGMDEEGIPWMRSPQGIPVHSAILTAQYALANITLLRQGDDARADRARAQVESLVATQERQGEWAGCWVMTSDNPKYEWLRAPWVSALASGNSISALLRAWEVFGESRYLTAAEAAYVGLHRARTEMRLVEEAGDELWYEEYPADPPMRVLNGHVYALLGVLDYARVSNDAIAHARWRRAAATLLAHIDEFDLGYWSAYDLRWREPAMIHYQKNIHVPQMRILAALTGKTKFADIADRWEGYLGSVMCRLRWMAAVRLHARLPSGRGAT